MMVPALGETPMDGASDPGAFVTALEKEML